MNKKILQVFYGADALPYKDKERTVHFPIVGNAIQNANNTTQIKFYFDRLVEENEQVTFVAVSKLPNGKIGSKILETYDDDELGEQYALLDLDSFYTQYKGDVFISLQGYQGGVRVEQDEQGIYQIYGTPVIATTGSIKLAINYAPSFVGSGETENVTLQQVLGELSTKLGVRQETLHVEELPTVGNPDVWYVVNDDEDDPNKANIYIWNATTQSYVWVGDNTLDLGDFYTTEQGEQFENNINEDIATFKEQVENEIESVASGSPKGVYATLADLQAAYPTGTTGIYVVSANGHWYYWNGSAWTDGGVYLSSDDFSQLNSAVVNIDNGKYLYDVDYGGLVGDHETVVNAEQCHSNILYITGDTFVIGDSVYSVAVWEYDDINGTNGTSHGWQYSGFTLLKGHYYAFVFRRNDSGNITADDLVNIKSNVIVKTKLSKDLDTRFTNLETGVGNTSKKLVAFEIMPTDTGLKFSGNTSQSDPLIVYTGSMLFKRNTSSPSGDLTIGYSVNSSYSLSHGYALVFNVSTNTVEVVYNGDGYRDENNYILLYKHGTTIKGSLAHYYYDYILQNQINSMNSLIGFITKYKTVRLMSRQGQFYKPNTISNLPYNDRIAIKNASLKGFSEIRITIWFTSDHIAVLSHDATINSVARNPDGTTISEDVYINQHTLDELNEYDYGIYFGNEYAGQTITTLKDALLLCKEYNLYCCVEVYPGSSVIGDSDISSLCGDILDVGAVKYCEIRNPLVDNLQKVHNNIAGANLSLTFYASDGDSGVVSKITSLKAMSNHENTITMTTIPATINNASFKTTIQKIQKEGIPIELASVDNLTDLKSAISSGIANVIEVCYVENPSQQLYEYFINN